LKRELQLLLAVFALTFHLLGSQGLPCVYFPSLSFCSKSLIDLHH
jgi:hypothetical protein